MVSPLVHVNVYFCACVSCIGLITLVMTWINVSFCSAMSTETNKKLFLQQVEQILEGVMDDKDRVNCINTLICMVL